MNFNVLHHGDPKAVPVLNGDSRNVDFPFGPSGGGPKGDVNPNAPDIDKKTSGNTN